MAVAVTGYKGVIGSAMTEFLESKGHEVSLIEADLTKECPDLSTYDQIYHFAAQTGGVGYQDKNGADSALSTAQMDLNVLRAAGDTPIFYPSSACVYPEGKGTEDQIGQGDPQGEYGQVKLMMTKLSESIPNMRVGILGTIYGELHSPEKEKFPQALCRKVLKHLQDFEAAKHLEFVDWIELWGDGTQVRTFLWIDDLLEMIYELMTTEYHGPVNLVSPNPVTVKEAADILCDYIGLTTDYHYDTTAPTGHSVRVESTEKWNKHYKYRPQIKPNEGLKKLYDKIKVQQASL